MMSEKKYTFEDWLEDKPYFEPDSPLYGRFNEGEQEPYDQENLPMGMSLAEYNDRVRNTAEYLFHEEKVITPDEYSKINNARLEAFDIVHSYFKGEIERYLRVTLSDAAEARENLKRRLKRIDEFLENASWSTILDNLTFNKISPPQITGSTYTKIKDSQNKNIAQSPLLVFGSSASILQPVVEIPYEWRINEYLEAALLLDERKTIKKLLADLQSSDSSPGANLVPDRRGDNSKQRKLIANDDFFIEAKKLYNKYPDKALSSRKPKSKDDDRPNASKWLYETIYNKRFQTYETRDKNRLNPRQPSYVTVKNLLNENKDKWQVRDASSL